MSTEKRKTITWQNFKKDDFITYPSGDRCKILARIGEIFARSACYQFEVMQDWMSIHDAKIAGMRFIQPGNKTEMTVEELETLMGHPIKIIK